MPTPLKFGCLSCVVHRVHTVFSARWRYCDVLLLGQQVLLSFVGGTDLSLAASEGLPVLLNQYFCMNMMSKTGHHTSVPLRMLLMLWREQASPLAWCPANQSLAGMCRRYKMPPATSSPGAALGLSAHRRNFVHAVSDSIVVVSERNFRIVGCFVYHWLCWSLPGNIASNVISRSLGEISMIHGQPKRTKPNMFTGIAMHTALDVNNPRIRSSEARACKRYDWGNADAFFLAIFSGLQDTLPTFGRCPSSLGAGKPCTCQVQIFNLLSCVLGRIKEGSLIIRICPWIYVKTCCIKEADFSKGCTYLRHLRISHYFCWIFALSTDILRFTPVLLIIWEGILTSVINWFNCFN